jgi:hypothetical protein
VGRHICAASERRHASSCPPTLVLLSVRIWRVLRREYLPSLTCRPTPFKFADPSETYQTGDAFYVPAGHTPANAEDTEYVQFSPTEELAVVSQVIERNLAAMQAAMQTDTN